MNGEIEMNLLLTYIMYNTREIFHKYVEHLELTFIMLLQYNSYTICWNNRGEGGTFVTFNPNHIITFLDHKPVI